MPPTAARIIQTMTVFLSPKRSVIMPRIMLNAMAGQVPALNTVEYCCSVMFSLSIRRPATGAIWYCRY